MSYHTPTSTALDEIFIFSESDYIKVDGNCYQKVVGDFGLSTHKTTNINSIELNCEACRNKIKTINPEESITVTDEYQCVEFNLASGNTSNINIYNGRTTLGFKVLNDGNNLVWDNDDANSSYFSFGEVNQSHYFDIGFVSYKVELIQTDPSYILCFYTDPFRERCSKKKGFSYKTISSNTFDEMSICINDYSGEKTCYNKKITTSINDTLNEYEILLSNLYLQQKIIYKFKINRSVNSDFSNDLMFWNPTGSNIQNSSITLSLLQSDNLVSNIELINLTDHDLDGIPDSNDPYPYGGNYSDKLIVSSSDSVFDDFVFGDTISLEVSPSEKSYYISSPFSKNVSEAFLDLKNQIKTDFDNQDDNIIAFINQGSIEIWNPCSLKSPTSLNVSLNKTPITVIGLLDSDLNSNGEYYSEFGSFTLTLNDNSSNDLLNGVSDLYFKTSQIHNGRTVFQSVSSPEYLVRWNSSNWEIYYSPSDVVYSWPYNTSNYISLGSEKTPSTVIGSSVTGSLNVGYNNLPTYSNSKGYYIFNENGIWYISNGRYYIGSNYNYISEMQFCGESQSVSATTPTSTSEYCTRESLVIRNISSKQERTIRLDSSLNIGDLVTMSGCSNIFSSSFYIRNTESGQYRQVKISDDLSIGDLVEMSGCTLENLSFSLRNFVSGEIIEVSNVGLPAEVSDVIKIENFLSTPTPGQVSQGTPTPTSTPEQGT